MVLSQAVLTPMFQVSTWFFTTFSVPGVKEKVHHIETLQQLFTCILPEQIDIPPFVLEYDTRVSTPTHSHSHSHTHTLSLSLTNTHTLTRTLIGWWVHRRVFIWFRFYAGRSFFNERKWDYMQDDSTCRINFLSFSTNTSNSFAFIFQFH